MSNPVTKGRGKGIEFLRSLIGHKGDDCIPWPMARNPNGRGYVGFNGGHPKLAHRVMCELAHGPAPEGKPEAAHTCGKGHEGCVNPNHLEWKSKAENQQDKRRHGTNKNGKDGPGTRWKLTPEKVSEIRAWGDKITQPMLALMYGTSWQNIGMILRGKSWKTGKYETGTAARLATRKAKSQ